MKNKFNVKILEGKGYIKPILDYLEKECGLEIKSSKLNNHIWFYKGILKERKKQLDVAVVGYGGSGKDLRALPTPLQTELLPLVFDHWHKISNGDKAIPLLILGHSFDEVFLRKIRLLSAAILDIRLIQFINVIRFISLDRRLKEFEENYNNNFRKSVYIKDERNDLNSAVVKYLNSGKKLSGNSYDVLDCEVSAGEGTKKSEAIDILALESERRWLTVIELKYGQIRDRRLKSVIFQGLDYCNWVEDHKRGLAMLFSPKYRIDTRRRTRLILINGPEKFPSFHKNFAKAWNIRDRYQEIELYYTNDRIPLEIRLFAKTVRAYGKKEN